MGVQFYFEEVATSMFFKRASKTSGSPPRVYTGRPSPGELARQEALAQKLARGAVTLKDQLAPDGVYVLPDRLEVTAAGTKYCRTLAVKEWPREVEGGWLNSLYAFQANLRLASFIFPQDTAAMVKNLTTNLRHLETTLLIDEKRGRLPDPYVLARADDAKELRDRLARGETRIFQHYFLVTVVADSTEELEEAAWSLESELRGKMAAPDRLLFQQDQAYRSTLPLGRCLAGQGRYFDTESLATTFPFVTRELIEPSGVLWGINKQDNSLVLLDRWQHSPGHALVVAASGAGKSYQVKSLLLQERLRGCGAILIDPSDREYHRWCRALGGQYVRLGLGGDVINPLDLVPPPDPLCPPPDERLPVTQKVQYLKVLLRLMSGEVRPEEMAALDALLYQVYREKGIADDWASVGGREMPTLADVLRLLWANEATRRLAGLLAPYVEGSLRVFSGRTNVDLAADLVVFDIHDLVEGNRAQELRQAAYFVLTEFILQRMRRARQRRILNIDEAHYLFRDEATAKFLEAALRTARKYNVAVNLISQRLADFSGEAAGAVLANTPIVLLMRQLNENELAHVANTFRLSDAEVMILRNAGRGEGLLLCGEARVALEVRVPPAWHRFMTTDPAEVAALEAEEKAGRG